MYYEPVWRQLLLEGQFGEWTRLISPILRQAPVSDSKRRKIEPVISLAYSVDQITALFGSDADAIPASAMDPWSLQLATFNRAFLLDVNLGTSVLWRWCQHEATYHILAHLMKQLLHIQVTSAPSERVWSFLHNIERRMFKLDR